MGTARVALIIDVRLYRYQWREAETLISRPHVGTARRGVHATVAPPPLGQLVIEYGSPTQVAQHHLIANCGRVLIGLGPERPVCIGAFVSVSKRHHRCTSSDNGAARVATLSC